jgi:transposase-like protein
MDRKAVPPKTKKPKRPAPRPLCPECGSDRVVPVLHGLITPALRRKIDAGRAVRADREEWEGMMEWHCKACGSDWSRHSRRFKRPGAVNATQSG